MRKQKNEHKPGVMVYFDLRESISMLTQSEKGDLLDAILTYGQDGQEPEFADRAMCLLWSRLRLDIQRDDDRYQEVRLRRIAAANKRWHPEEEAAETPDDPVPEEEAAPPHANASTAMQTMPATATATASATAAAATPAPVAAATPTAAATPAPSPTPAPASTPAAAAAPASYAGVTAPAPLRRNTTHLPDCVTEFVRRRERFGPEEHAIEQQKWHAALAALPEDGDTKSPALAVLGGAGAFVPAQRSLT